MVMSESEFARLIGTSRQTVNNLVKDGVIEKVENKIDSDKAIEKLKADGKIDENNKYIPKNSFKKKEPKTKEENIFDYPALTLSDAELEAQRAKKAFEDEMKKEEAKKIDMPLEKIMNENIEAMSKNDVERVKLYWQGMQERAKYEMLMLTLVSVSQVEDEHFVIARTIRNSLLSMSNRIAHKLLNQKSIHEIKTILDAEANKVLENLSK